MLEKCKKMQKFRWKSVNFSDVWNSTSLTCSVLTGSVVIKPNCCRTTGKYFYTKLRYADLYNEKKFVTNGVKLNCGNMGKNIGFRT